jgi:hypothetical protein
MEGTVSEQYECFRRVDVWTCSTALEVMCMPDGLSDAHEKRHGIVREAFNALQLCDHDSLHQC